MTILSTKLQDIQAPILIWTIFIDNAARDENDKICPEESLFGIFASNELALEAINITRKITWGNTGNIPELIEIYKSTEITRYELSNKEGEFILQTQQLNMFDIHL